MGTRGLTMVYSDGEFKVANYNQYDSYPSGLGIDILIFIRDYLNNAESKQLFRDEVSKLKLVNDDYKPTKEEYNFLTRFSQNPHEYDEDKLDVYLLLRDLQGVEILYEIIEGNVIISLDSINFASNSLYCEWGYVLNLDERQLEIYKGYQKEPCSNAGFNEYFAGINEYGYYGIQLVKIIPFDSVYLDDGETKNEWDKRIKRTIQSLGKKEKEEYE